MHTHATAVVRVISTWHVDTKVLAVACDSMQGQDGDGDGGGFAQGQGEGRELAAQIRPCLLVPNDDAISWVALGTRIVRSPLTLPRGVRSRGRSLPHGLLRDRCQVACLA